MITNADCLEYMKSMPDSSVDLIATDPPYFRVKTDSWDRQWGNSDSFLQWLSLIVDQFHRILKPNGSLYVFASPQMASRVEVEIMKRFKVLNHIVWMKDGAGPQNKACKEELRCFFPQTERIVFAEHYGADGVAKGVSGYSKKCDELRGFVFEPLRLYLFENVQNAGHTVDSINKAWRLERGGSGGMAGHWLTTSQWALPTESNYKWLQALLNKNGSEFLRREYEDLRREYEDLRREYEDLRRPFYATKESPFTDVWRFRAVSSYFGKHPCEKPLELMEHIVKSSSRKGDLVFDCFAGSGTTGVAAIRNGRRFLGVELNPQYCARAMSRITHPHCLNMETELDMFDTEGSRE
jgi:adenine-specific DNA-methyltransferase